MPQFKLVSDYHPQGDQPQAIQQLVDGFRRGDKYQTLLGVTGSGKTYTAACVIEQLQRPVLVISHNKTLAAQLYTEFREFFPENAVHYFVSFYDYYQPEAYIPQTDTFIEKDLKINDEINRLRLAATTALLTRQDVIIVASVSCIYGIGSPDEYEGQRISVRCGTVIKRRDLLRSLVDIRYQRNDVDFSQGTFRARGDVIEVFPAYANTAYRIELFGDEIDRITEIDTLTGEILHNHESVEIYPAKHFMTDEQRFEQALLDIELELQERIENFTQEGKLLEAQRIEQRTRFDLEMLREAGYCQGIENYSRHFSGLKSGEPPYCLMNFFPEDYLVFVDESHVSLPQIKGMYRGDRSRKQTLVEYGFRLPSALDNRPLQFEEFEGLVKQALFISATPAEFERTYSSQIVEQLIRPTGLVDPRITVHPVEGQVDHLIGAIQARVAKKQRTLVITLTKRMSEDLADYLTETGIRVRYLHSEIDTLERPQILQELREGRFDVLVGINLLREGLDLPEVSLVAILDADKEGFLRTETSLIQTAGRAARHIDGEVILYADKMTEAMSNALRETERRRKIQVAYNEQHGVTPESIAKHIRPMLREEHQDYDVAAPSKDLEAEDLEMLIEQLSQEMRQAAAELDFERAAVLRDQIQELKEM